MKKIIYIVFLCMVIGILSGCVAQPARGLPVHNVDTGEDFATIQEAIYDSDTTNGHTIEIDDGVYNENVIVNKSLSITSTNQSYVNTIVDSVTNNHVFDLTSDACNISYLTISNATNNAMSGIYTIGFDNHNIHNVYVFDNNRGIYLRDSDNHTIEHSIINQTSFGIYLFQSNNNIVQNTTITGATNYGFYTYGGNNITVADNTIINSVRGIYINGAIDSFVRYNNISGSTYQSIAVYLNCSGTIVENNTIDGGTIGIFGQALPNTVISNNTISNTSLDGIRLLRNSNYNTISNNTISNTGEYGIYFRGMALWPSGYISPRYNTIRSNTITDSNNGIYFEENSNYNTISNNSIYDHTTRGIYLRMSNYTHVVSNTIYDVAPYDMNAVYMYMCRNSTISENNIYSTDHAIEGIYMENTTIETNNLHNNDDAIYIRNSTDNNILDNTIYENNMGGIEIYGFGNYNNNTIINNTIYDSYSGIRVEDSDNNYISENYLYDQLYNIFMDSFGVVSNNTTIVDNVLNEASYSLQLHSHTNLNVINNSMKYNPMSIRLYNSSDVMIYGNTIGDSSSRAIQLFTSSNVTFQRNRVFDSGWVGMYIRCSNNTFFDNYFDNDDNVDDSGVNTWNVTKTLGTNIIGGPYIGGNYWSNYEGEDLDDDGLGDTLLPYNNSGGIQTGGDYHPLTKRYEQVVFHSYNDRPWVVCVLFGIVLFFYRKKKQQQCLYSLKNNI